MTLTDHERLRIIANRDFANMQAELLGLSLTLTTAHETALRLERRAEDIRRRLEMLPRG